MKCRIPFLVAGVTLTLLASTSGQGTFWNLNFESPILPLIPDANSEVPIANAMPGWAGSLGENVLYNTLSLGAPAISFHTPASSSKPIQGNYSVILQPQFGGGGPLTPTTAVSQTGQIPQASQSLIFLSGSESMQATFSGQSIPLFELGRTSSYLILGGDISSFAGQTGELRFTQPSVIFSFTLPYLDDIQFSTQQIPEPGVLGLFAFGALLLGWRLRHKTR